MNMNDLAKRIWLVIAGSAVGLIAAGFGFVAGLVIGGVVW